MEPTSNFELAPTPHAQERREVALHPHLPGGARALLEAVLQATDYGILVSDLARQDILANRRLGELFDLDPHEIVDLPPGEVLRLACARMRDPQGFAARVEEIVADPWLCCEDELETTRAEPRLVRRSTSPILDADGQPIGRLWTFLDVTATRRLQTALADQLAASSLALTATRQTLEVMNSVSRLALTAPGEDELLQRLAAAGQSLLPGACYLAALDRPGVQVFASEGAREAARVHAALHGTPAVTETLRHWREHKCPGSTLLADFDETAPSATSGSLRGAPLYVGADLAGVVLWHTAAQLPAADAPKLAHLSAVADQMGGAIAAWRARAELEATQAQMVQVAQMRTAGLLSAAVAHDIRNILTPLQIDMAVESGPVPEAVRVQIARLAALTHQLLAIAAPEALDLRPVDLGAVIRGALPLVERQAGLAAVSIRNQVPADLPQPLADWEQLQHLVVNLALNAIEAMASQGGGVLTLAARTVRAGIELLVQDTGPGVPLTERERIFTPFATTKRRGLGLGLFSCRRIARDHGGELILESPPEGGATFVAHLPAR